MRFDGRISVVVFAAIALVSSAASHVEAAPVLTLHGRVESDGTGLAGYQVSLLASFIDAGGHVRILGRDTSRPFGGFRIDYRLPHGLASKSQPVLFVLAEKGPAMLASAVGRAPLAGPMVVNELTTVATGFAFAQFVDGKIINGNRYGMVNAVRMAANLANPETGRIGEVLDRSPNGHETEARPTFYSLANIVASCVATAVGCEDLFEATTLPGGSPPNTVIQAVANMAKYPWLNVAELFDLSFEHAVFGPALPRNEPPDAWTLFLKFTGSFSSVQNANNLMNGPGNFAIDREGFLWVSDNYVPVPPFELACAAERLLKFYPWGENFPGSPYFGGGLSGAGFGITIAPNGLIWVGNFGFAGTGCPPPPANSVSVFRSDGEALSHSMGLTAGPVSWPQATVADRKGNIWIANCAADSVTLYPRGRPGKAFEIPIPPLDGQATAMKPFGVAIDRNGRAWATGSFNSTLAVIGPDGGLVDVIPPENADGRVQLRRPMGIASDSRGNIWVANSDFMDVPCPPDVPELGPATAPSIALFQSGRGQHPHADSPFSGGGLTIPWGVAIDGNDTVWVANFGFPFDLADPVSTPPPPGERNRVSHFCGVDTAHCPPTKQEVGQAISPDGTGYASDALIRNTGIAIDPSGNVWLVNNWKDLPLINNPGGNSIAVLIGAAAPVRTPLIGPPRSFSERFRGDD
jgi:hypothetical protein